MEIIKLIQKNKGYFLIELLMAAFLFAMVSGITTVYFTKFLGESKKLNTYMTEKSSDRMIEFFFEREKNCTETLRGLGDQDRVKVLKLGSHPSKTVEFYPSLKNLGKIEDWIELSVKPTGLQHGIATLKYRKEKLNLQTGEPIGFTSKEIPIFVSLNDDRNIESCLKSGLIADQCKGDFKNVIFYNDSSLIPTLYKLIKKPKPHGTEYKTTMSQIYDKSLNMGIQCQSHLYCDRGEWMSSIKCYNSCSDKIWTLGDDDFKEIDELDCQSGEIKTSLGEGRYSCKKNKKSQIKWCPAQKIDLPSYAFSLSDYCDKIKATANWESKYSQEIKNICERSNRSNQKTNSIQGSIDLPAADFGRVIKKTYRPPLIRHLQDPLAEKLELGEFSLFARCEYTGFFNIISVSLDTNKEINRNNNYRNVWGREDNTCKSEYITSDSRNSMYLCDVDEKIKICHPDNPFFCPVEKKASEIYEDRLPAFLNYIPQGLPLRFSYSHIDPYNRNQNFSGFFTVMCDKQGFCDRTKSCQPEQAFNSDFRVIRSQSSCTGEPPQLDLVIVIDSSGSMQDEQERLSNNLNLFFDQFLIPELNIDYNIAILDTELGDGETLEGGNFLSGKCDSSNPLCRQKNISATKADLRNRVKVGASGIKEYSFKPVYNLKNQAPGFFRKNAVLAIFFLTDEDDQDYRDGNTSAPNNFINFLKNNLNKDLTKKVLLYTGVNDSGSAGCDSGDEPVAMREALRIARNQNTLYTNELDLCDTDWRDDLVDFGNQIRSSLLQNTGLNSHYKLKKYDKQKYGGKNQRGKDKLKCL